MIKTVAETLDGYRLNGPEQGVKNTVSQLVAMALGSMPADIRVNVTASGHARMPDQNRPSEQINVFTVSVQT